MAFVDDDASRDRFDRFDRIDRGFGVTLAVVLTNHDSTIRRHPLSSIDVESVEW